MMSWAKVAVEVKHGLILSIFLKWSWQVLLMDCLWDVKKQGVRDDNKGCRLNNWKDVIAITLTKKTSGGTDFEEIIRSSVLDLVSLR